MLEKEQSYVDKLRSELAKTGTSSGNASNITTLQSKLLGAERRLKTLQEQLTAMTTNDQVDYHLFLFLLNEECNKEVAKNTNK